MDPRAPVLAAARDLLALTTNLHPPLARLITAARRATVLTLVDAERIHTRYHALEQELQRVIHGLEVVLEADPAEPPQGQPQPAPGRVPGALQLPLRPPDQG